MGGQKGQGGTSYQSSQVQIPPEVMARYNAVNARAETAASTPWQAYGGEFVAPVNQTQTGGINTITNAAGVDTPYFNQATGVINQALPQTQQLYGTAAGQAGAGYAAGQQYTQQGLSTAAQTATNALPYSGLATGQLNSAYSGAQPVNNAALGLAAGATGAVNPGDLDIGRYMSPYNEAVVQSTLGNLRQEQGMAQADLRDNQIMSGSFGGDRSGVGAANLRRQQDMAYGQVASQLYNANYGQGLAAAQQQQGVNLGAGQANRQALASGAQNIAGIGNQMFGQGAAAAQGNLGIGQQVYGQGQGLAAAQMQGGNQLYQQGVGAASTNAGLASGMAGTAAGTAGALGNLGTQQLTNQLGQGQAQIGAGTVQQQTQQAQDTALYNQFLQERGYPFQVAQFLANIAMGTGAQSGSTTNTVATQAQPYFSDERLKENVHVIGHTNDGQPIIRFNYKGDKSTQIGLSAQETEKHHPEAVGLASGFKTVDYDAATRDSIGKAGGGGLSAGNDNFAQLLAAQRSMFPGGAHDPRGIATGVGPHGVPIAPLRAQAPQAAKVEMQRPQQQTGAKRDIDSVMGLYNTGKGLASAYSEGKDALVGTAGKGGKDGTGGLLGTGGKWDPKAGWFGRQVGNDNATTPSTAPPAPPAAAVSANDGGIGAPDIADAGFGDDAGLALGSQSWFANGGAVEVPNIPTGGLGAGMPFGEGDAGMIPTIGKGSLARSAAGAGGDDEPASMVSEGPPHGGAWAHGGRIYRAAGGLASAMPYDAPGYIPEDLYKPIEPEKPDEADKIKMGGPGGGGGKDGTGKAVGSLAGMGIGAMFGMPGLGSMIGGGIGGMFNGGGRVGLAAGGGVMDEDEASRIALEGGNVLPFARPGPRAEPARPPMPVDRPIGLATPPPDETPRGPAPLPVPNPPPALPGTPQGLAAGQSTQNPFPESGAAPPREGVPMLPDGTPVPDGPVQRAENPPPPTPAVTPAAGPVPSTLATAREILQPARDAAASPGFDSAVGFTLRHEGGYNPRDSNGVPVNFGINQQFHPNVDVSKLTQDQAREIYRNQYWNAIDGDKLDPRIQQIAFDTAVISGPAKAKEFLAASGGDPAKFLQLREAFEEGLIQQNPDKYGKYRQAWATRRADLGKGLNLNAPAASPSVEPGGLATGSSAAPAAQETPDFIDRAGNWIDRNQRPIMAGLAFIGNMLGSKSHQLTGAIGDGLAAAAPMYMATGFKETELKQSQQRVDITARAQLISVLEQLKAMQSSNIANGGQRSPEIDAQIANIAKQIAALGGSSAAPGGTGATPSTPTATPVRAERTDLAPQGVPGGPPPGDVSATPLPPPAGATPTPAPTEPAPGSSPTPASNVKDPYAMPAPDYGNTSFRARMKPEMNPDTWLKRANEIAQLNPQEAARLRAHAQELELRLRQTGETVDVKGQPLVVPGWREEQAAKQRMQTNPQYAEDQRKIAAARELLKNQVTLLKDLTNKYESGALNSVWADIDAKLKAVNLPGLSGGDAANYQQFMKEASAVMLAQAQNMPAGHGPTDALRQQISTSFAAPTLDPEANRKILANTSALINWADKNYTDTMRELETKPWLDTRRYYDDWKQQNDLRTFTKDADKETTTAGMAIPKTMAELEDGRMYNMTPQDVFNLYRDDPNVKREDIVKRFGNRPRVRMRVVTKPDGSRKLEEER